MVYILFFFGCFLDEFFVENKIMKIRRLLNIKFVVILGCFFVVYFILESLVFEFILGEDFNQVEFCFFVGLENLVNVVNIVVVLFVYQRVYLNGVVFVSLLQFQKYGFFSIQMSFVQGFLLWELKIEELEQVIIES